MTPSVKRVLPFALAMASGLVTSGMLYSLLTSQPRAAAATGEAMVITATAVDDSHVLTAADLKVVSVASRPAGTFTSPQDVIGRLPLVAVPAGQPLLTSLLAAPGTQPGLWRSLPKGKRAVTVAINEVVGVGGFVKPGLDVDIIGVSQDGTNWVSGTVAQDVPVLAIAQDDKKDKEDKTARVATSATLMVDPAQAEAISLASEKGRIRLVLRPIGDHTIRPVAAPKVAHAPAPAPAAPRIAARPPEPPAPRHHFVASAPRPVHPPIQTAPAGIEVIRGTASEVVRP